MRLVGVLIAALVCLGLGSRAFAGPVSPLLEGDFLFESEIDHNECEVRVLGGRFEVSGAVTGGAGDFVTYDTVQPTSVSRSAKQVSIKQNQFVSVNFDIGGTPHTFPIEKCSASGSFTHATGRGTVSLSCKGDDLSAMLNSDEITAVKTAMTGRDHVKFKVDSQGRKWSLSVVCAAIYQP